MVHIGIDFGTTYCCIGYYNDGIIEIIPDEFGNKLIPSCVYMTEFNTYVGFLGASEAKVNPKNGIFYIKRLISRNLINVNINYTTKLDKHGKIYIEILRDGKTENDEDAIIKVYPERIVSLILEYLKGLAESYLNKVVTGIVITAPAYFDDLQKKILFNSAKSVGLDVKQIISEPTAAALCYINRTDHTRNVLVYDIGGGTLDISLVECSKKNYNVLFKNGDPQLGGINFDHVLEMHILELFLHQNPDMEKYREDIKLLSRINNEAENVKKRLSVVSDINTTIENIFKDKSLKIEISKLQFENMVKPLLDKCDNCLLNLIKQFDKNLIIHDLIFIGGSSRIPAIRENTINILQSRQKEEIIIRTNINPDEAVAHGAAIQSDSLEKDSLEGIKLNEIVPQDIGIQINIDQMSVIIPKNTKIPCTKIATISTYYNNQTKMGVKLFQGDNPSTKYNILIGKLEIDNIPPRPQGEVQVTLELNINKNNTLTLSAYEATKNIRKKLTLDNTLDKQEEIEPVKKFSISNRDLLKSIIRLCINKKIKNDETDEFIRSRSNRNIDLDDPEEYIKFKEKLEAL